MIRLESPTLYPARRGGGDTPRGGETGRRAPRALLEAGTLGDPSPQAEADEPTRILEAAVRMGLR